MPQASLIWSRYCPACGTVHETRILTKVSDPNALYEARDYFENCCDEWFEKHLAQLDADTDTRPPAVSAPAGAA